MKATVRKATDRDAGDVAALNQVVQRLHADEVPWLFKTEGLTSEAFTSIMQREDTLMFVAEIDGEIAGYLFAELRHHHETSITYAYITVHIHHICVHQRFRRCGVASSLLNAVVDASRQVGAIKLTADVWNFNEASKALFARAMDVQMVSYWQHIDQ